MSGKGKYKGKGSRKGLQFMKNKDDSKTRRRERLSDVKRYLQEYQYDEGHDDDTDEDPRTPVDLNMLLSTYGDSNSTIDIEDIIASLSSTTLPGGMVVAPICEQIGKLTEADRAQLMSELLPHAKVINVIDQWHDFINLHNEINDIVFSQDDIAKKYASVAIGSTDKINVAKSHIVQQEAFGRMYEILERYQMIVPSIGPSRFVNRIRGGGKLAYHESGRKKGDEEDGDEEDGDEEEDADVAIQSKTVYATVDGATHRGVNTSEIFDNLSAGNYTDIEGTNNRRILTILLFGDQVQALINPYDPPPTAGMYPTDTSITMTLTIINGDYKGHFVKLRLIGQDRKSKGISVNSVLNVFGLADSFPDAIRGKGDAPATFRIESQTIGIPADIRNFLGLSVKTVCDQVLFSETDYGVDRPDTGFANRIDKVLTVDLYVHAGIRANYLLGRVSELPAIYEMTKGGWMERPGISNMENEIKSRFMRAFNMAVYLGVSGIHDDEIQRYYRPQIVANYASMKSKFYTSVRMSHKIVSELKVADNIFTFMSSLLALYQANAIESKINALRTELERYIQNPIDVSALFKIPFLESILELPALDAALRNQQTLITTSNTSIYFTLTKEEEAYMTEYENGRIQAMTDGVIIPTNIMRDVCKNGEDIAGYGLVAYAQQYYGKTIEEFCAMLTEIDRLSAKAFIMTPRTFDIFGHLCLGSVTFTVNVEANTVTLESFNGEVSRQLGEYYGELEEESEEGEGPLYKYKSGQLIGRLQYEILWILSAAILKAPFKSTRDRSISKETEARKIVVTQHAKYLYDYFAAIGLDDCLRALGINNNEEWFTRAYCESILAGVRKDKDKNKQSYQDFLHIPAITMPLFLSPDESVDKQVESMRIMYNESLPGGNMLGGKKRKRKNTRKIKKQMRKSKTVKRRR